MFLNQATLNIAQHHHFGELHKLVFKISFETKVTYARFGIVKEGVWLEHFLREPHVATSAKRTYSTNRDVILLFTTP